MSDRRDPPESVRSAVDTSAIVLSTVPTDNARERQLDLHGHRHLGVQHRDRGKGLVRHDRRVLRADPDRDRVADLREAPARAPGRYLRRDDRLDPPLVGADRLSLHAAVAFHCIFILGFQTPHTRVLVHSILGSFFYGVFAVKVLIVRDHSLPGWVLPVAGGALFTLLDRALGDLEPLVLHERPVRLLESRRA